MKGAAAMGEFAEGSYIDSDRKVYLEDGSADPLGRWIDETGYVRLEDGDSEDGWYVDGEGNLCDGDGVQQDESLEVPDGWQVGSIPGGERRVGVDETLWTTDAGQDVTLSGTQGESPSPQALQAFQQGIHKTAPGIDAMGGDLSWAGGEFDPDADLHGRELGADYVGEDQHSNAFRPGDVRSNLGPGDQWTTIYGVSGDATMHKSVAPVQVSGGLLVDSSGQPLDGQFGYVVDAADGTLYTFDRKEVWVTLSGAWVNVATTGQGAGMLVEAAKRGEQVQAVHHSTAVSGQPVAGAGSMKVTAGKITEITNDSGHYQPEAEYLWQTMEWLVAQGMPVDDINVRTVATTRNAEEILKAWQFRLAGGNVAQARAKQQVMGELARREREKEELALQARVKEARQLPGDELKIAHQQATGCKDLEVSAAGNTLYCASCDTDLPEKYRPLLAQ
jgi:hypothetical protein